MNTPQLPIPAQVLMYLQRLSPTMQRELLTIWKREPTLITHFFENVMQKQRAIQQNTPGALTEILKKERDEISLLLSQE